VVEPLALVFSFKTMLPRESVTDANYTCLTHCLNLFITDFLLDKRDIVKIIMMV